MKMERSKSTMFYFSDDEVDNLSKMGDDNEQVSNIQWIGFQQQFFTTFLRFDINVSKADIAVSTLPESEKNHTVAYNAVLELPADAVSMHWYFVPNHFGTLNKLGFNFDEVVPLGWAIFGWVNRWFVIPLFNFFDGMNLNYGIIILIMSILIKLILFPFQIKSYVSMAKIRVLKPEIDEINKKHEDQMKRQQAVMELYRQTGANPLGGCLPMLFQLPFLIALFQFFPASFELRQQSFLWADDLSSYDSIFSWTGNIPLISSFYGNHISLFTILMAASLFFYTKINQSMTPQQGGAMAAQMKIITYLMPFMMLFWFNSYASGLSYYYFLANVISFGQQWAIRRFFIDEEAIHAQLQEKKAQPKKTGNRFQRRLEEVMKEQQKKQPKK
jgi:YidC/Oxa1 family membrane protein insertase